MTEQHDTRDEKTKVTVGPSYNRTQWNEALYGDNDGLLRALVETEPPGVSLVEMAGYVNGLYRRADLLPWVTPDPDLRAQIARVTPLVEEVRSKLSGKGQREIDLAFLASFAPRVACPL